MPTRSFLPLNLTAKKHKSSLNLKRRIVIATFVLVFFTTLLVLSFLPIFEDEYDTNALNAFAIPGYTFWSDENQPSALDYTMATPMSFNTGALASIIIDLDSLQVLAYSNPKQKAPMASTTKIMTALVVLELMPLDSDFIIPKAATGIEGSSIYLYEGEKLTIKELLYGLMLESGNDSATALAIATAGSEELFVELMNAKAKEMGLKNTLFANPHGLPAENHYTTAEDLALITATAMQNKVFAEMVATKKLTIPYKDIENGRYLFNHNKLLMSDSNIIGVKTGYTKAAGRCLVTAYSNGQQRLAAVTLNCSADLSAHRNMYSWATMRFEGVVLALENQITRSVPVVGGRSTSLTCRNNIRAYTCLPIGKEYTEVYTMPRFLYAPVKKGSVVGYVTFFNDEEEIFKLPLIADSDIDLIKISFWDRLFIK